MTGFPIIFALVNNTQRYIDPNYGESKIIEDIEDIVEDDDYIKFLKMDSENDFFECIQKYISTSVSGSNLYLNGYLYQCIFESMAPDTVESNYDKVNKLGIQFTNNIYTSKPIIILKHKILSDSKTEFISISNTDVKSILKDKFIKTGCVYKLDKSIELYNYYQNHLDGVMKKLGQDYIMNNFQYDEIEICDMIFIISSDKSSKEKNDIMTKIVKKDVFGDVYCSLYNKPDHINESFYISIDKKMCSSIIELLILPNFDPTDDNTFQNFTPENIEKKAESVELKKHISPIELIDRLYNKYKKKIEDS